MLSQTLKVTAGKSFTAGALFLLFITVAAVSARAQVTERMRFTVPFEFTAGGERLPAGEYTVRRMSETTRSYVIQSRDGRATAIVSEKTTLRPVAARTGAQLVFNVYGGQHFLAQIHPGGDDLRSELHRSRAERELSKVSTGEETITLAALRE